MTREKKKKEDIKKKDTHLIDDVLPFSLIPRQINYPMVGVQNKVRK
jgi:hypothetical protein